MAAVPRPDWAGVRDAVVECTVLAVACLITYLLVTQLLSRLYFISRDDDLLGGMWAVIATIFVNRASYQQSWTAAVSRTAATFLSLVICLIYLAFLPFHVWALPVLIGVTVLAATLIGRQEDAILAAITTTVLLIVVAVSPQHAWLQPILRFGDTVVGVVVGIVAAWGLRAIRSRIAPASSAPSHGRS
ncbi:MAG TPA: FUSC family protein [Trebonia sp.]